MSKFKISSFDLILEMFFFCVEENPKNQERKILRVIRRFKNDLQFHLSDYVHPKAFET